MKKLKQGVKDYVGMFSAFHEAWKGREDSYNKHFGIEKKKKKKKK